MAENELFKIKVQETLRRHTTAIKNIPPKERISSIMKLF
jgi:hypothetical protein